MKMMPGSSPVRHALPGRRAALVAASGLGLAADPRPAAAQAAPLVIFAAGSLREAVTEIGEAHARSHGRAVTTAFGYSGLMRERIERGERADILASADMGHPMRLLQAGRASQVAMFARNALCVVAPPGTGLTEANLLDRLLDPSVVIGVFPAVQDPVGDYTVAMFERVDAIRPGAGAALRGRAQVISPAMAGRPLGAGEDLAVALLRDRRIGLHVSYASTARRRLAQQLPGLEIVDLPAAIRVGPEYGLALLRNADPAAAALALFMLSTEGQRILARHGFAPVGLPEAT